MTQQREGLLSPHQLAALKDIFHQGSLQASAAMAKWLSRSSVIELDSLEQLPLEEATGILGETDDPVCSGCVHITGFLTGEMLLSFDEASGFTLVDMLLGDPQQPREWSELAISAVLETANILCCSYLNSLASTLTAAEQPVVLLPTAPTFNREFAECLLEFALMEQATYSDSALVARTKFSMDATSLRCHLLFLPDAPSLQRLADLLGAQNRAP